MNDFANLYYKRAHELSELSRWQDSIIESQKCLSMDPQHYHALCNISRCYFELEDYEKCLQFAQKAIAVDPTQEWAYRLQSCVYSKKKKTKKRLEHALEAVKKEPESVLALQTLAYAQLHRKKFKDAAQTAEKIRSLAPDSVESHKTIAYVEFSKNNLSEAEKHFRQALKIEAVDYEVLNSLGEVLIEKFKKASKIKLKQEILNEAIDCLRQAVAIDPNRTEAKKNLKNANLLSVTVSHYSLFPVFISLYNLVVVILNTKAPELCPDFLNIKDKPPEIVALYIFSWLSIMIAAWGIAAIKAGEKLTEANKNILQKVEDNNLYVKIVLVVWLLVSSYPLIFMIWKMAITDFQTFYLFNFLDWITLVVGLIALGLNTKLISPYLFEKKLRF